LEAFFAFWLRKNWGERNTAKKAKSASTVRKALPKRLLRRLGVREKEQLLMKYTKPIRSILDIREIKHHAYGKRLASTFRLPDVCRFKIDHFI